MARMVDLTLGQAHHLITKLTCPKKGISRLFSLRNFGYTRGVTHDEQQQKEKKRQK
jgi:hypothetical protein